MTIEYTEREVALMEMCADYEKNHSDAGAPGHNLFILVAKLCKQIEELEEQKGCWME